MKPFLLLALLLAPAAVPAGEEEARILVGLEREADPKKLEDLLEQAMDRPYAAYVPRLFELTRHLEGRVRWTARAAIRSQGAAALPRLLEELSGPATALGKAALMESVFEDRAFHVSEAVPALSALLKDPLLREGAAQALGRMALPESVEALEREAAALPPSPARDSAFAGLRRADLASAGAHLRLLQSPDPLLRLEALKSAASAWLPGFSQEAQRLARKEMRGTALGAYAASHLGAFYLADLFDFFLSWLPASWRPSLRSDLLHLRHWGRPSSSRPLLWGHLALMGLSFFLGAMLLLGQLRPFEPYRFTLHVLLMLLLGLAGDVWLFLDSPWLLRLSAASRLTLLAGLFRARRDLDPGQADSLWASLAGWLAFLILPAFFYFSGELWGEALRSTGARKEFVLAALFLFFCAALLALDLRLKGGPRLLSSLRSQAFASEVLLAAFALLLAACPWRAMQERAAARDYPGALVLFLTLAPLLLLAASQLAQFFKGREDRLLWRESPSQKLKAYSSPDMLTVRLRGRRSRIGLFGLAYGPSMALAPLVPLAEAASRGSNWPESSGALPWLLGAGFIGFLASWNVLSLLFGRELVQIRKGRARRAFTLLGACLRGGQWKKQVPLLGGGAALDPGEKQWLRDCLLRSKGRASLARRGEELERPLALEILSARVPASGAFLASLRLRLGNLGGLALNLQDLEQDLGKEIFEAHVGGQAAQLYFSGADRERNIPASGRLELEARLAAPFALRPGLAFSLGSPVLRGSSVEASLSEGAP